MEFDTAKTLAAFGGLALGVINLGMSVYKDFLRGPKLTPSVDNFAIRCANEGLYDIQLDLSLTGHAKPAHLRTIELHNSIPCLRNNISSANVTHLLKFTGIDYLKLSPDDFEATVKRRMAEEPVLVSSLTVQPDSRTQMTILDRLESIRESDGWEDLPLTGWSLRVDYAKKRSLVHCAATPHQNGLPGYFSEGLLRSSSRK